MNNPIVSIEVMLMPQSGNTDMKSIESFEHLEVSKIFQKFSSAFINYAICPSFKLSARNHSIDTLFDHDLLATSICRYSYSYESDIQHQEDFNLNSDSKIECLFNIIKSADIAVKIENLQQGKDKEIIYKYDADGPNICSVKENNIIFYSLTNFPKLIKSLTHALKCLNNLNPKYGILFSSLHSEEPYYFISSIETHSKPILSTHNVTDNLIGKVVPYYDSGKVIFFYFTNALDDKKHKLYVPQPKYQWILKRIANHSDYCEIKVKARKYLERNYELPIKELDLIKLISLAREDREKLNKSISNALIIST